MSLYPEWSFGRPSGPVGRQSMPSAPPEAEAIEPVSESETVQPALIAKWPGQMA